MTPVESHLLNVENSVHSRYAAAAKKVEAALCCPVEYNADYLAVLPEEILERDYGCGDPSPYVRPGDTVLDLGSGGGKICYIAAQIVGPTGRVIGVDCNPEMLALARKYRETVAERIGYANVEFRCGMIQDLALDLDRLTAELAQNPVRNHADWLQLRAIEDRLRREHPLIESDSIDCVVSNCVLNLVRSEDRRRLLAEVFRVLKVGGRVAISDIVADETVPTELQQDPTLWSGCISGAFREDEFLRAFEEAGFHGIQIAKRQAEPWQTVQGIEFRSMTVLAYKGRQGPCVDRRQAVVYRGPFREVVDDEGYVFRRGERTAVCDPLFERLRQEPYADHFEVITPLDDVPLASAPLMDCRTARVRDPRETKGTDYRMTMLGESACCSPGDNCC